MPYALWANICISHKQTPGVSFGSPEWSMRIEMADLGGDFHGIVEARLSEQIILSKQSIVVPGGRCVSLVSVDAVIGFSEFVVKIDESYTPGTCEFDVIMNHEQEHIRANLSVMQNMSEEWRRALELASNSVMPIFVPAAQSPDHADEVFIRAIQSHPSIVLVRQRTESEKDFRNRQVDMRDDHRRLRACRD
ncbi:MAG: hypothetical protein FWC83_02070 [Alphaproteobacteria bacterium]|nr:hypothetical protein [Alphaproteobacteria bacterium]